MSESKGGGINFGEMLLVLFMGLKLTGHIKWAWAWVLSPIWIGVGVVIAIFGGLYLKEKIGLWWRKRNGGKGRGARQ